MRHSSIPTGLAALIAASVLWPACAQTPAGSKKLSAEHHYSFKGLKALPAGSELFGPGTDSAVHFEPEGLRLSLPAGWEGERPGTGWLSGITARGDFEFTLEYDMLDEPEAGERHDAGRHDHPEAGGRELPQVETRGRGSGRLGRRDLDHRLRIMRQRGPVPGRCGRRHTA